MSSKGVSEPGAVANSPELPPEPHPQRVVTANAAIATHAAYIDLNEIIALEFEKLGPEKVAPLFGDARTHSTPAGALLNAQMVVAGIRSLKKPDLKKYLSVRGKAISKTSADKVASMK